MPEAGRHIRRVAWDVVGQHDGGGLAQAIEHVGPRPSGQQVVHRGVTGAAASPTECGIQDGLTKADVTTRSSDACDQMARPSCADPGASWSGHAPARPEGRQTSEITGMQEHDRVSVSPGRWRGVPQAVTRRTTDT